MAAPEQYHWQVTYKGKNYDFWVSLNGDTNCVFSTDRWKVVHQEDPDMGLKALLDPKARMRLNDLESEFSVSLQVDSELLKLLKESWDTCDLEDPKTIARTPENVALESKIDDAFIPYLENEVLPLGY